MSGERKNCDYTPDSARTNTNVLSRSPEDNNNNNG